MSEQPPGNGGDAGHGWADDAHRYRLDSRIATGGMGEVWRATDTTLGRTVAVKLLKAEYADDATFRSRFETEARHAASLHHPGIASVFDFGEAAARDGSGSAKPYLVMELVSGEPLSELLVEARKSGRDLDASVVAELVGQAGDALGAAHAAGIVHRDVKPANLMVTPEGTVKITDFGIARAADGVQITQTGAVMGTPQYLAPEQARGERATAASDVYALGVVAFECLAGRRPFEADTPVATALAHLRDPIPELPARVPSDLAAVVTRSLAKDPAQRYPDGRAFATAVRRPAGAAAAAAAAVAAAAPSDDAGTQVLPATSATPTDRGTPPPSALAPEPGTGEPEKSGKNRTRAWVAALAVLLVVAVVVALFVVLGGDDEDAGLADDEPTRRDRTGQSQPPDTSPPPTESSEPPEPETVNVDPDNYVGNQFDTVSTSLTSDGLNVSPNELENDGSQTEGEVTEVSPTGDVPVGTAITVSYWGPPAPEPSPPTPTDTTGSDGGRGGPGGLPDLPDIPGGPGRGGGRP